jgi:hypothetical protein
MPTLGHVPPAMVRPSVLQRLVQVAEPSAGSHGRDSFRDADRVHGCDVDHDASSRGMPRKAVPAAAWHGFEAVPSHEPDRLGDVLPGTAAHHGSWTHMVEPCVERGGRLVVGG